MTDLVLIRDGHAERRALRSYFGAWVVCTERWSPYQIDALGADGTVLVSLHGPPELPADSDPTG